MSALCDAACLTSSSYTVCAHAVDVLDPPKGVSAILPGELDNLHATFDRLQGLLEAAHAYVADVVVSNPPHIEEQGMGRLPYHALTDLSSMCPP